MSSIFGGSKSKQQSTQSSTSTSASTNSSESGNRAFGQISEMYSPLARQGLGAISQVGALLGLGGDQSAAGEAYRNYLDSTDYSFTLDQGNKNVINNMAVAGALGSGKTLKALQSFGQNTAQKYFGDYISRLLGIGQAGQNAGQLITSAGQYSNSQGESSSSSTSTGQSTGSSSSSPGMGGFIGSTLGSAAASDRRLKKDVVLVDRLDDGLGVYEWTYVGGGPRFRGHMADEIEVLRPWALGPEVNGFKTVNYAEV